MTQELFFENYLSYPRSIKIAVGLEIDLDVNNPQPVGPKDNEIWYWGEYYDIANAISVLRQQVPYDGPTVLSNEKIGNKYVITFGGPVTELGVNIESMKLYPLFMNYPNAGVTCNITGIEIPNSVTSIGSTAFSRCTGLTSVTIPNSVTSIGDGAFQYCSGLISVTIPNSVTSIGAAAFQGCSSLTSMTISNSVTSIGEYAFSNCSGLTAITIPDSVTSIGDGAFQFCSGLTSVTCEATTPPTLERSTVFYNTNNCPIYVPAESVDAYKTAENWSDYADRIQAIQ